MARGERNGRSKLTSNDVQMIRTLRQSGVGRKSLAQTYGVGCDTIRDIMEGRTWGWLDAG